MSTAASASSASSGSATPKLSVANKLNDAINGKADNDEIAYIGFWMMIIGGSLTFGFLFTAILSWDGGRTFGIIMTVVSALVLLFGGLMYAGVFNEQPKPTP